MAFYEIFFSPTGGTKKCADALSAAFDDVQPLDMIAGFEQLDDTIFDEEDICLFAVPVFGGRIPSTVPGIIHKLGGNGAKAVLMAVYGNRAVDDAMAELEDLVTEAGFTVTAGVQAVAQHSIANGIAAGRPDEKDAAELKEFGDTIRENIKDGIYGEGLVIPGNRPYKEFPGMPVSPDTDQDQCDSCGICAKECPAGAIPADSPWETKADLCITCLHCISVCPQGARSLDQKVRDNIHGMLSKICPERNINKLFI